MSDLLNQASLVMVPSGYKEDTVYSVVPTDGSGDLSFTRASNGTRINSAGLVEVCPWNLLQQSETFNVSPWVNEGNTVTNNSIVAPNGTTTADTISNQATTAFFRTYQGPITGYSQPQTLTFSTYFKYKDHRYISFGLTDDSDYRSQVVVDLQNMVITQNYKFFSGDVLTSSIEIVGDGWYRIVGTFTYNTALAGGNLYFLYKFQNSGTFSADGTTQTGTGFYMWGAQFNFGSTAKPYFPTTDRLNVPRLTYQNGGGGCPSLLLEKQSTNLVSYSNGFDNSYWDKTSQGVGSNAVVTPNYTTSPDGTNNAFRFQCNLNGGTTTNDRSWMVGIFTAQATSTISIYIKLNSAGTKTIVFSDGGGDLKTISNTEWQRIDGTFSGASGQFRIGLIGGLGASDTLDCSIAFAQAESGSYPTSYIPTTSSSATRVADVATVNLPNTNMTFTAYLELDEASLGTAAGDWFSIYSNVSVLGRAYGYANTFGFADAYNLGVVSGAKMVWKQESGSTAKIFKGGALVGTSTTGTYTNPFNRLRIDGALLDKPVKIKQFVFFDNALTDAECIQLTA